MRTFNPRTVCGGRRESPTSGNERSICIVSKMLGKESLWNVWRAGLPSGSELEQATMEKLRAWAAFLDPDQVHSSLVVKLALQLYDGVSQCGILRFSNSARRILEAAAILHEIGRSNQKKGGHQKRGYRMVCKLNRRWGGMMKKCDRSPPWCVIIGEHCRLKATPRLWD